MPGLAVPPPMAGLVIKGATVVDARGERSGDVCIRDGRIVEFGDIREEGDEPVLAASGRYVTPGLIDCHVHLCYEGGPSPQAMAKKTDAQLAIEAAAHARSTLMAGVTTARDCGGRGFVETLVRDAIRGGLIEGPRLFTSGHPIVKKGGHMSYYARQTEGPADCATAAKEQVAMGVDWLKVVATGGITSPNVDPEVAELTEEMIRAVVEEGRRAGKPVAAHAHGGEGIRNALAAGVRSLEHGTFLDEAMIGTLLRDQVYLVPTLVATRAMIDAGTAKGVPEFAVRKASEIDPIRRKAFAEAVKRGVRIAMGTDAGTPFNLHGENAREVELMVEGGMTTAQALEASTVTAAKMLGIDADVGLVAPGYAADLLVLRANPLDDPAAFRSDLAAVVRSGRLVLGPTDGWSQ
jgi:imidazolonepropionase-like amidohydrolase